MGMKKPIISSRYFGCYTAYSVTCTIEEHLFQFKAIHLVQFKYTVAASCSLVFSVRVGHLRKNSSTLNGRFVYFVAVTVTFPIKPRVLRSWPCANLANRNTRFPLKFKTQI
jgi:hypothetical protein